MMNEYEFVVEWIKDSSNVMTNIVNGGSGIWTDMSVDEQYDEILRLLNDLNDFLSSLRGEEE